MASFTTTKARCLAARPAGTAGTGEADSQPGWKQRCRITLWLALGLYAGLLLIGTHLPSRSFPSLPIRVSDKLMHFYGYFGLTVLVALAAVTVGSACAAAVSARRMAALGILLALYGLLDEITQPLSGRQFDLSDWAANLVGIAVGLGLIAAASRWGRAVLPGLGPANSRPLLITR